MGEEEEKEGRITLRMVRHSTNQYKKVPNETKVKIMKNTTEKADASKRSKGTRNTYKDYKEIVLKCRTTGDWLGSQQDSLSEDFDRTFIRDSDGNIVIKSGYILAMIRESLQRHGQPVNAFTKVFPSPAKIKANGTELVVTPTTIPVLSGGKGQGGTGKTTFETLGAGHEFMVEIDFPGSVWSKSKFKKLFSWAGRKVGLYGYRKGDYGLFEIVEEVSCL